MVSWRTDTLRHGSEGADDGTWPDVLSGADVWKKKNKESGPYSDLVVVALVLHVLVKFFLGVKLDATHLQFLPHLQRPERMSVSRGCLPPAGSRSNTHPLLELLSLLNGHRVGLGNDWDDVDRVTQALHEFNVQLTEPGGDAWTERIRGNSCSGQWPLDAAKRQSWIVSVWVLCAIHALSRLKRFFSRYTNALEKTCDQRSPSVATPCFTRRRLSVTDWPPTHSFWRVGTAGGTRWQWAGVGGASHAQTCPRSQSASANETVEQGRQQQLSRKLRIPDYPRVSVNRTVLLMSSRIISFDGRWCLHSFLNRHQYENTSKLVWE